MTRPKSTFSAREILITVFRVGLRSSRSTKLTIPFDKPAFFAKVSIEMPCLMRSFRKMRTTAPQVASTMADSDTYYV